MLPSGSHRPRSPDRSTPIRRRSVGQEIEDLGQRGRVQVREPRDVGQPDARIDPVFALAPLDATVGHPQAVRMRQAEHGRGDREHLGPRVPGAQEQHAAAGGAAPCAATAHAVRRDVGVPRHLEALQPGARVVAVGVLERARGAAGKGGDSAEPYDRVVETVPRPREDPCEQMRRAMKPPA